MSVSDNKGENEERTFAALPPTRGRGFAQTWWGQAWLKALEDTALDGEQLKKGRRHAREGAVGAVSVRPGRITAVVRNRDGSGQRSDVLLQELSEEEWDRFLDMAVDRAGHIAALLDRDMPPHLMEDAAAAGVELLPGIGDLEPECTCEAAWDHCPHTAALCYQVARLLDQDPFVLLLMRGRGERRLLDELQLRSVKQAQGQSPEQGQEAGRAAIGIRTAVGVRADEAFAARDILPPLPAPPPVPDGPGTPPALDTETAPAPGIDAAALEFLAADAAARAYRMLSEALSPGHEQRPLEPELTPEQDAVRLAASALGPGPAAGPGPGPAAGPGPLPGPAISKRLAGGTDRHPAQLGLAVRAWRHGGAAALSVLEEEHAPEPEALARAGTLLAEAWEEADRPQLRASGPGRWTVVGAQAQLRLGQDGRWWPYRKERGQWAPAGPANHDPAAALAEALAEALGEAN